MSTLTMKAALLICRLSPENVEAQSFSFYWHILLTLIGRLLRIDV